RRKPSRQQRRRDCYPTRRAALVQGSERAIALLRSEGHSEMTLNRLTPSPPSPRRVEREKRIKSLISGPGGDTPRNKLSDSGNFGLPQKISSLVQMFAQDWLQRIPIHQWQV